MKILLPLILILTFILNYFVYDITSISSTLSTYAILLSLYVLVKSKYISLNLLGFVILFILICEIIYAAVFHEPVSGNVIDSLVETNSIEAGEMISVYLIALIVIFTLSLLIFSFVRKVQSAHSRYIALLIIIFMFMPALLTAKWVFGLDEQSKKELNDFGSTFASAIKNRFPCVIGNVFYATYSKYSNDKYMLKSDTKILNAAIVNEKNSSSELIVLIMGESAVSIRHGAYSYSKNTTPNMSNIFNEKNGCIVKNVHSSAPLTRNSIPMTLSFSTPESELPFFENKSIIEMAKDRGFKTFWLGSQEIKGYNASKYGAIALQSDVKILTLNNDIGLVNLLRKTLNDKKDKKFIVIHLRGSHIPYTNFDSNSALLNPEMDNYDLTVLRTDSVVKSIYDVLSEKEINFSLIYTSDHGEIVNKGHGFKKGREQYLIPFMFYSKNNDFDCLFIESFKNKDGWLSGLMNKYILSEMLGYEIDEKFINEDKNNDRVLNANNQVQKFSTIQ
ncbi:MAG: phosphoethanolamine transferase [Morganella sp. (in: enterobacteria)]|uniref:phosphoethanolamine transferase n=1 Tax=Morganella morganii TaxID=582 RepID=UPI001CED005B|nr:phosphoethanolamine transferase [Morganella morganii]